jgi:F0F1-type ATP synthase gamma subunit
VLADDILKNVEYDALRVIFNKFQSVISFKPTIATILSPEVISDLKACELVLQSAKPPKTHYNFIFCS